MVQINDGTATDDTIVVVRSVIVLDFLPADNTKITTMMSVRPIINPIPRLISCIPTTTTSVNTTITLEWLIPA